MARHLPDKLFKMNMFAHVFQGTAVRMFLVLTLALLPLALIALIATLQSIQTAEAQKQQLLLAATEQSAGKLESHISAIRTAQTLTVNTLAKGSAVGDICGRMRVFVRDGGDGRDVPFLIIDRAGKALCGSPESQNFLSAQVRNAADRPDVQILERANGLLIRTRSDDGNIVAATFYRRAFLDHLNRALPHVQTRAVLLGQNGKTLRIGDTVTQVDGADVNRATAPVGDTGIDMTMIVVDPPLNIARLLSLFLPLLMWFAAAILGWLVVRWLLIKPLVALREAVVTYEPGRIVDAPRRLRSAAKEIAELRDAFRAVSQQVADHEQAMRSALDRQTQLTREVHHRVKNNIQIISSLISLHARAASEPLASRAYTSIQRRVDALAVVQRNLYAELEENSGVRGQALISEITASLRASMPDGANSIAILVDCDPVYLHQDVAAPVAFLIAELADLAMISTDTEQLRITLIADSQDKSRAHLAISSDAFLRTDVQQNNATQLYARILNGLSRQLRAPLDHDDMAGEYRISLSVL